ncbi:MAG: hypothetical protein NTY03_07810 [Candidatus Bathyarchaeota archaeon]|nr:hypothetical protein [Candidatus Bathyarchaeota archaeon]
MLQELKLGYSDDQIPDWVAKAAEAAAEAEKADQDQPSPQNQPLPNQPTPNQPPQKGVVPDRVKPTIRTSRARKTGVDPT